MVEDETTLNLLLYLTTINPSRSTNPQKFLTLIGEWQEAGFPDIPVPPPCPTCDAPMKSASGFFVCSQLWEALSDHDLAFEIGNCITVAGRRLVVSPRRPRFPGTSEDS